MGLISRVSSRTYSVLEEMSQSPAKRVKLGSTLKCLNINPPFNMKRVRHIQGPKKLEPEKGCLYYMRRDQRIHDNWALIYAQKLALESQGPLQILVGLDADYSDQVESTERHARFFVGGVKEMYEEAKKLNIGMEVMCDVSGKKVCEYVKNGGFGGVVMDFSPLRYDKKRLKRVGKDLDQESVLFCQVDAHNIVPVWEASDKQEYAARTIRR